MEVTREVSQSPTLGPGLRTVLIHHARKIRPLEVTGLAEASRWWNQELPVKDWKILQVCVAGWQNERRKSLTGQRRQYNHLPPSIQNNWINKHHTIKSPRCLGTGFLPFENACSVFIKKAKMWEKSQEQDRNCNLAAASTVLWIQRVSPVSPPKLIQSTRGGAEDGQG